MSVIIKKPAVGNIIQNDAEGYSAKVIRIVEYKMATSWMDKATIAEFNKNQEALLGPAFRTLYYEVYLQIKSVDNPERYQENEIEVIDWQDFQNCTILG